LSRSPCDTSIFRYCNFKYGKSIIVGSYWQYEIEDNKGGAIYANNYPAIKISNCSFLNNYALNSGGAVYFYDNNYVNVENCNFKNNKTIYKGGGISLVNCDNVFIENNEFIKNIAFHVYAGFAHGLGAAIMSDNPGFSNTRIINNKCYNNKTLAGTIYESNLYHTITGNLLCNNFGIALFNGHSASYGKYMNNNIINNYYTFLSGMQCSSSNLLINSNIFWNNETYTQDTMQILFVLNSNPTVIYNCIQYGQSGEGNIDQNPLFVNPSPGAGLDYHGWLYDWSILDSSPCINAGTPDTTGLFIPEYDIAGNPRICGFRIDMGAYENQQFVFIQSSIVSCKQNNIYPNPGRNKLTIKTTTKNSHFELFDITGKILLKKFIPDYSTEVNVSNLPKGMYFYRIYDNKNIIKTGKWVKQ